MTFKCDLMEAQVVLQIYSGGMSFSLISHLMLGKESLSYLGMGLVS